MNCKLFTFFFLFYFSLSFGQIATIDFETANAGYTPSSTTGSGTTDIFDRTSSSGFGGNNTFFFAAEDILSDQTITLDQINISGFSSFTFSIKMLTPNTNDWDSTDELLITYSIDGGASQNLMWVQSGPDDASNEPAMLDLDFNGTGDIGQELPAISDDHGAGVGSNFETFTTNSILLSNNSTLDISLQFNTLTSNDEGIYIDDIIIDGVSACTAPTVQPSNVTFANVTGTTMDINWTQGNGDGSMVVIREASAVSSTPANGTAYTANPIFGSGDDIGTNEFVVFRSGAASTVSVTGLSEATTYHVAIFEYNNTGDCYLSPSTAIGNQTTTCATPTEVMNPSAAPSNGAATITWNDASCFDEILVVASTASVTGIPLAANSGGYSANSQYGMGNGSPDFSSPEFPVFKAVSGNSIMVTGLTNSTQYFFKIFTRKGAVWSTGVEVNTTPLPVLFIEDFDDNTGSVTTNYSPSQFNFASGTDYFGVVCQNGNGCGNEIGSGISFTGGDGDSFLGAHDTDGGSAPMPSVTFEDINVSGAGTLYICFEIAEDDDGSNQDWDDDSSVSFEVDFDNAGSFGKVIQFSGGGATNTEPGVDSNCDGIDDGAALSDNFTTYCFGINGSGNTMDLRILITGLNAGDEDVAIDNIQLFDGDANLPVAATSSACAAALPIELAYFRGEYVENQVDLTWQTFSETNNDYFEIEHSLDGKEFSTIGMVEGNGTVYTTSSYNFPHENPAVGMNYYRLKQFDFDGNFSYSNVVIIETERFDNEVSIFPNPFSNELTLQFTEENENVQTIQIVNLNGQVLFEKTAVLNSNETIDLAYLNNGIYFLRISDDKHSIIRKIEKF